MIFSRGRGTSSRHAPRHAARRRTREEFGPQEDTGVEPEPPERGPYDVAQAPSGVALLDLGSLRIPAVDGVEVRLQAGADGAVQQVTLAHGPNLLQLGVFAAPRSEGIWEEVRAEIRQSLAADGMTAQEVEGEYGTELLARVRTPEGRTDLRFVGIDGPRWMVRAVYQGPAATDPAAAGPLAGCLAGLVVDRGSQAMPARDALPLRLPREMAEQMGGAASGGATAPAAGSAAAVPTVASDESRPGAGAPGRRRSGQRPRR